MRCLSTIRNTISNAAKPVRLLALLLVVGLLLTWLISSKSSWTGNFVSVRGKVVELKREPLEISGGYRSPIWTRYRTTLRVKYMVNGVGYELSDAVTEASTAIRGNSVTVFYERGKPHRAYIMPPRTRYGALIVAVAMSWFVYEIIRIGLVRGRMHS